MKDKPKKPTRAELQCKIDELTSALGIVHRDALLKMAKASTEKMLGSAVLLRIDALGGTEIVKVTIRDGLSPDTIECLKRDVQRSLELIMKGL